MVNLLFFLFLGLFLGSLIGLGISSNKQTKQKNSQAIAQGGQKKSVFHRRNPYWPCIPTKEETRGMSERDVLKIYEPALPYPDVHIALSDPKNIKLPTTDEEKEALKKGLKYVWCDGYESETWQERECKYLGIRITDSFILHETIITKTWSDCVRLWREKCKARYLLWEEIMLLNYVWQEVSNMRETAHDVPLIDSVRYWYDNDDFYFMNRQGEKIYRHTEDTGVLMMAVI